MTIEEEYTFDIEKILSHRHDNGADFWATPDKRLIVGSPFQTLQCPMYLLDLGMDSKEKVLLDTAELIFSCWREDGRFRLYPKGSIYPCQTANAAKVLCHLGYATDPRIERTFAHLLEIQWHDGGLRCEKFLFGRGPETEFSNPMPTLTALSTFRFAPNYLEYPALDRAVECLLRHWESKAPIGPCHYGIGTLFMQVGYPFANYNLFEYVYVLSFYERARTDPRFLEAFVALQNKTVNGQIVVERVVPKLAKLNFCRKGRPSASATKRYHEILRNLGRV